MSGGVAVMVRCVSPSLLGELHLEWVMESRPVSPAMPAVIVAGRDVSLPSTGAELGMADVVAAVRVVSPAVTTSLSGPAVVRECRLCASRLMTSLSVEGVASAAAAASVVGATLLFPSATISGRRGEE